MSSECRNDRVPYRKSNSVDENLIGGQMHSSVSAFDTKVMYSNNDNSQSNNNMTAQEDPDFMWKMLVGSDINLDDFPVPPLQKEYRNSTRLFVPIKREETLKMYLAEADKLVELWEYQRAKELYLKATKLDPLDWTVWK